MLAPGHPVTRICSGQLYRAIASTLERQPTSACAQFGYLLLWVIVAANVIALVHPSAKLGCDRRCRKRSASE